MAILPSRAETRNHPGLPKLLGKVARLVSTVKKMRYYCSRAFLCHVNVASWEGQIKELRPLISPISHRPLISHNNRDPRSLSFATSQQLLATNWLLCAVIGVTPELAELGQATSCSEQVGHRPDRVEPRKNKRRPKLIALMKKPRWQYQTELNAAA